MKNAMAIVDEYLAAMGRGDVKGARAHMRDDMKFSGPLDTFDRPEPYLQAFGKVMAMIERVDVLKRFTDGNDVVQLCEMHFKAPASFTMYVSEWYQVHGDKISSIRVVFDPRPMAGMMGPH